MANNIFLLHIQKLFRKTIIQPTFMSFYLLQKLLARHLKWWIIFSLKSSKIKKRGTRDDKSWEQKNIATEHLVWQWYICFFINIDRTLEKSTFFNKSNYRTTFPENETERMDGKDYGKLNTSLNRGYQDIQYKLSLYMEAKRSLISVTLWMVSVG